MRGKASQASVWGRRLRRHTILARVDDASCCSLGEEGREEVVVGAVSVNQSRQGNGRICDVGRREQQVAWKEDEIGL